MAWDKGHAWRLGAAQQIAIGASSTQNGIAFGNQTHALLLSATGNCHIAIGTNPTATSTSTLLKSSDFQFHCKISPGEKIAVIQDGASTGNLSVTELTN